MSAIRWCLSIVCITILGIPALSNAFDAELTPGKIDEAIEYGKKHKGMDIFDSNIVKAACFGEYPKGKGGLIMSKYIEIAIISAMKTAQNKPIVPEDIQSIIDSTTFNIVVDISKKIEDPGDVQITLLQGTNNVLPQQTEFGMKHKDTRQGVVGVFEYDRVDINASTTVLIKFEDTEEKYKIHFSHIK
ncbi:MAG: hypothetical protein KGJ87_01400 [Planctomycetota bacterium]|nr:hypothetical protein [Planctomycetota bacterium]MDE2215811.1 hypothetical protein [Planctomycetota bacterium]